MITTDNRAHIYMNGKLLPATPQMRGDKSAGIAARILAAHNAPSADAGRLRLKFDALVSHDITYVGIVQTARASGLTSFPVPYALTNCHNTLCAVGGTINEDDHVFGLSAAKRYGGIFVPGHLAVIHSYAREEMAFCGGMILGSDSHTRYGALGTMGVGEGGPELVKQLLSRHYEAAEPEIVAVYLSGEPRPGVGPQDVALALVAATFNNGFVKNKVLEFIGPGVAALPVEYRNGIDVMTTETSCLSSVWQTDERIERYYRTYGRPNAYSELIPLENTRYDGAVFINLSEVKPMIALPFHPANAVPISDFLQNAGDMLRQVEKDAAEQLGMKNAKITTKATAEGVLVDQGVIAGCAGGVYDNIKRAADILSLGGFGGIGQGGFGLSVYPGSQPILMGLMRSGVAQKLLEAGAVLRSAFCGPCFGAGDVPSNEGLSIRHTTRNFPAREGARPKDGQISYVALMDARSIAATALNGGKLTAADQLPNLTPETEDVEYAYDRSAYAARVYNGFGSPQPEIELVFGPNIADWPVMQPLPENLQLYIASSIDDAVTTTDELIPSGETSSYRSNPMRLAEFTLSRRDPGYVGRAKEIMARANGEQPLSTVASGSAIYARKPGDGSAREQAASCQKVLGGWANIAREYATKRYRSNLVNWGILPFVCDEDASFEVGDALYIADIRKLLLAGETIFPTTLTSANGTSKNITLRLPQISAEERDILLCGCLINYYRK